MTNQRVARGLHTADASRTLPPKRGEKICAVEHNTQAIRLGGPCPICGAVK